VGRTPSPSLMRCSGGVPSPRRCCSPPICLELDADYRPLPLRERKARLDRLVDRRLAGIAMVDHTDGRELVFEQACKRWALEGIVSKRLSKPYQSGRSGCWLKVKNPDSPAMVRHRDGN
jgi:bifunctional non-homologous end joining protein LigD